MEFYKYPAVNLDKPELTGLITIASGPVIIEDGKVLLDQHGEEKLWKFPGRKVKSNESHEETAKREGKEELGLELELMEEPFVLSFTKEKEGSITTIVLLHYFAKRLNKIVEAAPDIDKFAWFDVNNLPADSQPNVAPVVKHFVEMMKEQ